MTENMQVYDVQSRKALVVRCCLNTDLLRNYLLMDLDHSKQEEL